MTDDKYVRKTLNSTQGTIVESLNQLLPTESDYDGLTDIIESEIGQNMSKVELEEVMIEAVFKGTENMVDEEKDDEPELIYAHISSMLTQLIHFHRMKCHRLVTFPNFSRIEGTIRTLDDKTLEELNEYTLEQMVDKEGHGVMNSRLKDIVNTKSSAINSDKILSGINSVNKARICRNVIKHCIGFLDGYKNILQAVANAECGNDIQSKDFDSCGINSAIPRLNGTSMEFVADIYQIMWENAPSSTSE